MDQLWGQDGKVDVVIRCSLDRQMIGQLGDVKELLKRLQEQVIRRGVEDLIAWWLS